jgi:transcriptional regulator with XRE-family HTH domain
MTIGHRIKTARERQNMTLDEVARLCNTTKQTIFKYENEIVTNIPYDKIVLLSKALDVSPSYLFGWEEKESSPSKPSLTEGEQMLLNLFRQIPEDQQRVFLEMGRVYANSLKKD